MKERALSRSWLGKKSNKEEGNIAYSRQKRINLRFLEKMLQAIEINLKGLRRTIGRYQILVLRLVHVFRGGDEKVESAYISRMWIHEKNFTVKVVVWTLFYPNTNLYFGFVRYCTPVRRWDSISAKNRIFPLFLVLDLYHFKNWPPLPFTFHSFRC